MKAFARRIDEDISNIVLVTRKGIIFPQFKVERYYPGYGTVRHWRIQGDDRVFKTLDDAKKYALEQHVINLKGAGDD